MSRKNRRGLVEVEILETQGWGEDSDYDVSFDEGTRWKMDKASADALVKDGKARIVADDDSGSDEPADTQPAATAPAALTQRDAGSDGDGDGDDDDPDRS